MEEKVDSKIEVYLDNNLKAQIDFSLKKLLSKNTFEIVSGVEYFNSNPTVELSEDQLFKMIKVLERNYANESVKISIGQFLANRKGEVIDDFFKEKLLNENTDGLMRNIAISHLVQEDYKGDLKLFEKAVEKVSEKERGVFYIGLVETSGKVNDSWVVPLLNSKVIVDKVSYSLNYGTSLDFLRTLLSESLAMDRNVYLNTYFYTKK